MAATLLSRGEIFAGRYRIGRAIGAGGMGAVFEAEHLETEREVALKVLLPQSLVSDTVRERFKHEARVAGRIRHPHIVDVIDAGVDDVTSMPYLVMELLRGEDLGSRVERLGPVGPEEAVALLAQVASALDYLHERSIVHRDLKPANLFLARAEDGTRAMKLLDFGVAKVLAGQSSALTQDAQGTPIYMAPEQFAEQIRISPATDIYALGLVAFTLLTGKQYWGPEIERGMNVFMLARIAEAGPKEPATARARRQGATLPPAFDEWFSVVTAIVPGERYPTAGDAIAELAEALGVQLTMHLSSGRRPRPSDGSLPDLRGPPPEKGASASTPPIPLRRPYPFWRKPKGMTVALLALGGAFIYLLVGRPEPTRGRPPAEASSTTAPGIPAPPASATPSTMPEPLPTASASATSSLTTSSGAPSASTSAPAASPPPPPASTPTRRPTKQPRPATTKRPKYTRE